jgi:hypothetical protein
VVDERSSYIARGSVRPTRGNLQTERYPLTAPAIRGGYLPAAATSAAQQSQDSHGVPSINPANSASEAARRPLDRTAAVAQSRWVGINTR